MIEFKRITQPNIPDMMDKAVNNWSISEKMHIAREYTKLASALRKIKGAIYSDKKYFSDGGIEDKTIEKILSELDKVHV